MILHIIGVDLGQTSDFTAICILERLEDGVYHMRHLERMPLGTPYPDVAEHVFQLWASWELGRRALVVVDGTGCGRPVVDLVAQRIPRLLIPITITAGFEATRAGKDWRVPKRDLVSVVKVLLQTGRLKISKELAFASTLVDELLKFEVRINTLAHDTYGAWREGVHDDLVFAVALAAYYAETVDLRFFMHHMMACRRGSVFGKRPQGIGAGARQAGYLRS